MNFEYRREIDGLRAIAVLCVMLCHAKLESLSGGFVGVDVFFVISGFLITSHIMQSIHAGTFSYAMFWEKRARRIIPAFYLTLLLFLPLAWYYLPYTERIIFAKSMLYSLGFATNFFFANFGNYFDGSSDNQALLHMWSLAIEEQYYLIFPFLCVGLFAVHKFCKISYSATCLLCFVAIAAISVICSQYMMQNEPNQTYYFFHTRAFELLIGAILAVVMLHYPRVISQNKYFKELISLTGAGLIIYAVLSFDSQTIFPGFNALIPTIGTALLLAGVRKGGICYFFLALSPLVFIGKISYSAYLFHQPIFVFLRYATPLSPSLFAYGCAIVVILIMASLSFWLIEKPWRDLQKYSRKKLVCCMLSGALFFVIIAVLTIISDGKYFTHRAEYAKQDSLNKRVIPNHGMNEQCEARFTLSKKCKTGDAPKVVIWGDSFAMHSADMIMSALPNIAIQQNTISVCGPVLGAALFIREYPKIWGRDCIKSNDKVIRWIKQNPSVRYVVMSSIFTQYLGSPLLMRDGTVSDDEAKSLKAIKSTLKTLHAIGVTPIIITPPPQNGENMASCLVKAELFGFSTDLCNISRKSYEDYQERINGLMRELDKTEEVVWLDKILCDDKICKASVDGVIIYRDDAHLSHEGSAWIGKQLDAQKIFPLLF